MVSSKINLKDITFCIPVQIDSPDRLENVGIVVDYINKHFDTTIYVLETYEDFPKIKNLPDTCLYETILGDDTFHRNKIRNYMLSKITTKYASIYDVDVLFPIQSYIDSMVALKAGAPFVYPYKGVFYEVPRNFIPKIKETLDVDFLASEKLGINHPESVGGAFMVDVDFYKSIGGECELMDGWGWEDTLRPKIVEKLGHPITRVGTGLYHLEHWRGPNSSPNNPYHNKNMQIYFQVLSMNKEQLLWFISTYNRFVR